MLLVGTSEIVGSAEVFLGTHIYIVVVHVVEYSVNTCYRWYANRARRQSRVLVSVVWTVDVQ